MKSLFLLTAFVILCCSNSYSQYSRLIVSQSGDGFPLSDKGKSAMLIYSEADFPGVQRAVDDLKEDIRKVTGANPDLISDRNGIPRRKYVVLIGTLGKNAAIDNLAREGKIDVESVRGKWESYGIQVVSNPWPGVKEALIISGSDKRGTIYGIYEISSAIGVSPWYWWADVPVERKDALLISRKPFVQGPPAVRYRGIFLNDEHPNLTNWITAKYGTVKPSDDPPVPPGVANYNSEFYTKLFELILRLKGNYLWPAMWNNAFNEDDPANPRLADEYGIVMGNSHQEPMLRAQKEWDRRYKQTLGSWNFAKHPEVLLDFWREGIRRNKNYESIVTIGLRGADDTEMAPGGPEANMKMLAEIVDKQRVILSEEINKDVTEIPQLWCLYKEVQEYYNEGMRVPDDVTLLWAEDNWGNIRRVPSEKELQRKGGAGIYYHFDYHGGPRSYQWINTSPLPKIWDQMTFARQYGADRIWIVNVGHFKAYSLPMHYFLDLAFYGDSLRHDNLREYTRKWAVQQFGEEYADETTEILIEYTRFNGRRKPELLTPSTYSLIHYNEAESVVKEYNDISNRAEKVYNDMPAEKKDAYYQLVYFPVKASAVVNELYLAAAKNNNAFKQKRASTVFWADRTEELFRTDTTLMGYFNRVFAGGKWNHFMDQPHLGYISWRDPPVNSLQHLTLHRYDPPETAAMGVSIDGSENDWSVMEEKGALPEFDVFNRQVRFIDIFNKGKEPFSFSVKSDPWIEVDESEGKVETENRLWVGINWAKLPEERPVGSIEISGAGSAVKIIVIAFKPDINADILKGFVEANGYVSIEASHFTSIVKTEDAEWIEIEDYGHTLSGMRATAQSGAPVFKPGENSPCLEYQMYLFSDTISEVTLYTSPTLNFLPSRPVRYAISFDDMEPQLITLVPAEFDARNGNRDWEKTVSDNYRLSKSTHPALGTGYHTLKVWMVDPGVVIQKIVVDFGGVKPGYLGPPESYRKLNKSND